MWSTNANNCKLQPILHKFDTRVKICTVRPIYFSKVTSLCIFERSLTRTVVFVAESLKDIRKSIKRAVESNGWFWIFGKLMCQRRQRRKKILQSLNTSQSLIWTHVADSVFCASRPENLCNNKSIFKCKYGLWLKKLVKNIDLMAKREIYLVSCKRIKLDNLWQ